MKASDLLTEPAEPRAVPQRLCRDFEAIRYVKSPVVFFAFVQAGWLKPVVKRHKLTLFDYQDLNDCVDRMKQEGLPDQSSISTSRGDK